MMNKSTLFRLIDVGKHFGPTTALDAISLDLEAGQRWGVFGRNGAGKSCLLRVLSHLMRPSGGTILFQGAPVTVDALSGFRRTVGYLSHRPGLYGHLTARENLLFFARMFGLEQPEQVVRASLEEFGLADRAQEPVHRFSRGMLQRLALARCLLHSPRILLLDEPFTGLDGISACQLTTALERRNPDLIVLSTHQPNRVLPLVDRIVMLEDGRIQKQGEVCPENRSRVQQEIARNLNGAVPAESNQP